MKKLIIIIVIIISVLICGIMHTSCSSNPTLPRVVVMGEPDEYVTIVDEMCEKLETAFKQLSNDSLEHFFSDWNAAFSFETDMQNKIIEEIYKIYKEFYHPLDVKLNSDSKYAVVQNNILFAILDEELFDNWSKIRKTINFETIEDFRPQLYLPKDNVLYLTPEYEKALEMFMGTLQNNKEDATERYNFIRPYIPILRGHWWGWHIVTHPLVHRIFLDTNEYVARVHWRIGYGGGETIMRKKSDIWEVEKTYNTWIE